MVDRPGLTDCVTVEDVIAAFQNRLLDRLLVRLVDCKDEGRYSVTSVRARHRVTIDTGLFVRITTEVITRSFTHCITYRVEDLLANTEVNAVEVFLTVDDRIESMETCGVE